MGRFLHSKVWFFLFLVLLIIIGVVTFLYLTDRINLNSGVDNTAPDIVNSPDGEVPAEPEDKEVVPELIYDAEDRLNIRFSCDEVDSTWIEERISGIEFKRPFNWEAEQSLGYDDFSIFIRPKDIPIQGYTGIIITRRLAVEGDFPQKVKESELKNQRYYLALWRGYETQVMEMLFESNRPYISYTFKPDKLNEVNVLRDYPQPHELPYSVEETNMIAENILCTMKF